MERRPVCIMSFKQFGWVPDGTYDHRTFLVRYVVVNGSPTRVISKSWVDEGGPNDVSSDLKLPWGVYPDIPEKIKQGV